jgi:hypothetical protein
MPGARSGQFVHMGNCGKTPGEIGSAVILRTLTQRTHRGAIPARHSTRQRNLIAPGINRMGFEYGRLKSNSNQEPRMKTCRN